MRILWNIHLYPPHHNCGSEAVAHQINKFLISQGHQVRVIINQAKQNNIQTPFDYEGVEVMGEQKTIQAYLWADIILTHLDFTRWSIMLARKAFKPVIFFAHNDIPYGSVYNAEFLGCKMSVVYNSKWMVKDLNYPFPSMVFNPPCDWRTYDVCEDPIKNEFITLINLDENKGGKIFFRVAEAMPEKKFLGVVGSYAAGKVELKSLPNVTILPNAPDILPVYRKTRILLMLSRYESWGRTATEAMCSGIPCIVCPTRGLVENCDYAGIYVGERDNLIELDKGKFQDDGDSYDISSIVREIRKLDSPEEYEKSSNLARQRSRELDPVNSLHELHSFILNAVYA